ncbi:hypothetical protein KEJ45_06645 [Candidatus Bathyarchaeota archaeon]|nr:hypothetical protein [Candidatus Bathyarchaeota archaeon]
MSKRVCVQGILKGPFLHIPEKAPPYIYVLEELQTGAAIGITWRNDADFRPWESEDKYVTVVGVIRKGFTRPLIVIPVYYIEAEETWLYAKLI